MILSYRSDEIVIIISVTPGHVRMLIWHKNILGHKIIIIIRII